MSLGGEVENDKPMDLYSRQRRTSSVLLFAALVQVESHLHDLDELALKQPTPQLKAEIRSLRKAWNGLTTGIAGLTDAKREADQ